MTTPTSRESAATVAPEDTRVAAARYAVTDPVERELAEGRGVDLDVVIGLLAAYDALLDERNHPYGH